MCFCKFGKGQSMKEYKYMRRADNRRCFVRLRCDETGKASYLPTYGVTAYSDNTCTWDDFAAFCRRVGLLKTDIERAAGGVCPAVFVSANGEELSPIAVEDPPNVPQRWSIGGGCLYTPSLWIFGGN